MNTHKETLALPEPEVLYQADCEDITGYTAEQMSAHAAKAVRHAIQACETRRDHAETFEFKAGCNACLAAVREIIK